MVEIKEFTDKAEFFGTIGEMVGDPTGSFATDLVVSADFLAKVAEGDEKPVFVTVDVESGISANKRTWKPEQLEAVVEAVEKDRLPGYLGHPLLKKEEQNHGFPTPQVVWVRAKSKRVGEKCIATFKGYVLKTAEAREHLRLGLIDGVSIFGDARMRPIAGGYEVISFAPESIDFSRKGKSSMKSRVVSLTGEQTEERKWNMEPREIASLSPEEIKTHAPLVYAAIQSEATTELNSKIGEMETAALAAAPAIELDTKLKDLLKLSDGENALDKVTKLMESIEELSKGDIKNFVKELVNKKVKSERGRNLVHRMIGEMANDYDGELDDTLKKKITDDFNTKIEDDDNKDIIEMIGEMKVEGGDDDQKKREGGSRTQGRSQVGRNHDRNDDGTEKRGGLTVTKRKLSEV